MARATRRCVICGQDFACPPSGRATTCSPNCRSKRATLAHKGKPCPWLAELGQTSGLQLGTAAAQLSPVAGSFETNHFAKLWWVVGPNGERYAVRNLRLWCREHAELFAPDSWTRAYDGIQHVQSWLTGHRTRAITQWKGWALERPAEYPEEEQSGI